MNVLFFNWYIPNSNNNFTVYMYTKYRKGMFVENKDWESEWVQIGKIAKESVCIPGELERQILVIGLNDWDGVQMLR